MDDKHIEKLFNSAWQVDPPEDTLDKILIRAERETTRRKRWGFIPRMNAWKLASACVVLLVLIGLHMVTAQNKLFAVTSIRGHVTLDSGRILHRGDYVAAGSVIRTGKDGRISLVTRGGSLLHMDYNSELSVDGKGSAHITKGRLYCSNRLHEIKSIAAPGGDIRLLGTVVDTEVLKQDATAVTVVEGKVELENGHGTAVVDAGKRAVIAGSAAPDGGVEVNITQETAWYDGRDRIVSGLGEIAYIVHRQFDYSKLYNEALDEVWVMNSDGSNKHRVTSYYGMFTEPISWYMGSQLVVLKKWGAAPIDGAGRGAASRVHLLNIATGQDVLLTIPEDIQPSASESSISVSPDGKHLAIMGRRWPDTNFDHSEVGIWIYELETGETRRVFDELLQRMSWSPDSRYLIGSWGYKDKSQTIIDLRTGDVRRIPGYGGAFSPDGTKIAYNVRIQGESGVYSHGTLFVLDLNGDNQPIPVSPEEQGGSLISWSPDGTRILYVYMYYVQGKDKPEQPDGRRFQLFVANADGSGVMKIYDCERGEGRGLLSWAPDGKTIFQRTGELRGKGLEARVIYNVRAIAADGSGDVRELGGNEDDSILTGEELQQTREAIEALSKANGYWHIGSDMIVAGRLKEARIYYKKAADLLSELTWKYPLASLCETEITTWADAAYQASMLSDSKLLEIGCSWRMDNVKWRLGGKYPSTLPKMEIKSLSAIWNSSPPKDYPENGQPVLIDHCPGTPKSPPVRFTYIAPNENSNAGDVFLRCPNHPDNVLQVQRFSQLIRNKMRNNRR